MLDIRFIRENPEAVKENIKKKFQDEKLPLVDQVIELDAALRAAITPKTALCVICHASNVTGVIQPVRQLADALKSYGIPLLVDAQGRRLAKRDKDLDLAALSQRFTPEDILGQVCGDLGIVFLETTPICYKCYCSRERVTGALISLGRKELTEVMQEGKTFPVECQFCDTVYEFTPADIQKLLKNA